MSAGVLIASSLGAAWGQCTALGAIRWDAWNGAVNVAGKSVEAGLSPKQFQFRAPFCSRVVSTDKVEIDCSSQESMDRELQYAAEAGLDYWAFYTSPKEWSLSYALERYLASDLRSLMRFSVILTQYSLMAPPDGLGVNLKRFAEYVNEPEYQRVLGSRPLVYFLPQEDFLQRPGSGKWIQDTMARFRSEVLATGSSNPYLVLMDFNPTDGWRRALELGFDAVSSYAVITHRQAAPYVALAGDDRNYWERAKAAGAKIVPPIMTGWDRRPRVVNPVPWEKMHRPRPDEITYYYVAPTPEELAGHVAEAVAWVAQNGQAAEADTVIIYAWNENDEGGWLVPTLGEQDARVKAMGARVRQLCPAKRGSADRIPKARDFDVID